MKKIFKPPLWAVLLVLLFLHTKIKAQHDSVPKPKWEIGLNALWLDNKEKLLNNSLLLRYHIYKGDKSKAFRLRLGSYLRWGMKAWQYERHNFLVRIGHEWSKPILAKKNKMHLLYGFDVSFEKNKIEALLINAANPSQVTILGLLSDTKEIGLVGVLGAKYLILPSLSISIESNLMVSNWKTNINNFNGSLLAINGVNLNNTGGVIGAEKSYNSTFNVYFIPISILNISYHF